MATFLGAETGEETILVHPMSHEVVDTVVAPCLTLGMTVEIPHVTSLLRHPGDPQPVDAKEVKSKIGIYYQMFPFLCALGASTTVY